MPTVDQYHRTIYEQSEVCELLKRNPKLPVEKFYLSCDAVHQHNNAIKLNHSDLSALMPLPEIAVDPASWHKQNQQLWQIPEHYKNFDIAEHVLNSCNGQVELQRAGAELIEYAQRDLLPLLVYVKYLVDTMQQNGVVWGVGRGSSVASFVLYKIGLHHINSIEHELDFSEFMR